MAAKNPKIDAYIAKAAPFAQPILTHLRNLVHKTCPAVEENMKWGMPSFEYKGLFCGFASFKNHCTFGFWKAALMKDAQYLLGKTSREAMGNLGKICSRKDLPPDKVLVKWLKEAMQLNEQGIKLPKNKPPKHEKKDLVVPDYFMQHLKKNKKAWTVFDKGSYSFKKEYVEWITEAKTEATRKKRMITSIEWLSEGKPRNWKYMKEFRKE